MKKHLLGFAVFSSIFFVTALVFSFFYNPVIPKVEVVEAPVESFEKPFGCKKKPRSVTFEILSSNYFVDEGKIISKIRVLQPVNASKLYIYGTFSTADGLVREELVKVVENPVSESNSQVVTVETNVGKGISADTNLYAMFRVTETVNQTESRRVTDLSQTKAVLFVHGKSSSIKK